MIFSQDMGGLALNFVHKRIFGGVKAFVGSGFNPLAALGGFISNPSAQKEAGRRAKQMAPQRRLVGGVLSCPPNTRLLPGTGCIPSPGSNVGAVFSPPPSRCFPPFRADPVTGECKIFLGDRPGRDNRPLEIGPGVPVGDAVMGRFGAGLVPGSRIVDRAVCLRGMVLGMDGICYDHIANRDRMWPKGRAPLLTGGQMRAISIAATAGRRLERTTKRLQKIGLMKKSRR